LRDSTWDVILAEAPAKLLRPLQLIEDTAYAATWVYLKGREDAVLVVVRGDGALFTDAPIPRATPLSELGMAAKIPYPAGARLWSGAGLRAYLEGDRPEPKDVFNHLTHAIDYFMELSADPRDQRQAAEAMAAYVMSTYFLDALPVMGYLWATGYSGTGKTRLVATLGAVSYLGYLVQVSSTLPTLRDLAEAGATLALDEAETVMNPKLIDPGKRDLLLSGNRRGSLISVKEPLPGGGWRTRFVETFSARLFAAINPPDTTLASRAIVVPLVRALSRNRGDPAKPETWPTNLQKLVDDLWALGLAYLPEVAKHVETVKARASLQGRDGEPWMGALAVAAWLENGVPGLFTRLDGWSVATQQDREDEIEFDPRRHVLQALWNLVREENDETDVGVVSIVSDVSDVGIMREVLVSEILAEVKSVFFSNGTPTVINAKGLGHTLKRLGLKQAPRVGKGARWWLSRREVVRVFRNWYSGGAMPANSTNVTNVTNATAWVLVTVQDARCFARVVRKKAANV
jgi:hypothetical protein